MFPRKPPVLYCSNTGREAFVITDVCSKSIIIPCHVTKEKNGIYFHEIPGCNKLHGESCSESSLLLFNRFFCPVIELNLLLAPFLLDSFSFEGSEDVLH